MKQLLALFCAVVLLPTLNSYAWIGGPFSGNSFFDRGGDDGVYEAIATDLRDDGGNVVNGVGLYRWAVTNSTDSVPDDVPAVTSNLTIVNSNVQNVGEIETIRVEVNASNAFFGGINVDNFPGFSHSWFVRGIAYNGRCTGTVNSAVQMVAVVGIAFNDDNPDIGSSFSASMLASAESIALGRFEGEGAVPGTGVAPFVDDVNFFVLGSKVDGEPKFVFASN